MVSRIFFTGGSNYPSGGGRVLNEVVNLARERGYDAWLCLPEKHCQLATFVSNPAPVRAIEGLLGDVTSADVIVFGWHSAEEYELLQSAQARLKVFWQHGNLIPVGPGLVAEKMLQSSQVDQYWNVSTECALFITEKYGIENFRIVPPFFEEYTSIFSLPLPWHMREGILVQQRRGFELFPIIERIADQERVPVTVLKWPFHNDELLEALNCHKFFISFDRGLRYNPTLGRRKQHFMRTMSSGGSLREALSAKPTWVKQEQNLLGFPISAAQAARQGAVVIGFAMGGGLEWMSPQTTYLAQDGSGIDLGRKLRAALRDSESNHQAKRKAALSAVKKFSAENTWAQIESALGLRGG